jgi:ADP-ribose pyrophosphatase YjhB (NUDIX family)
VTLRFGYIWPSVINMSKPPRLAVRAIIMNENRLLVVNAWKGRTDLWCAPGGGVDAHDSLPDNLRREVTEETGLTVTVGAPCLVNEFHDPDRDFHQVDVYFRCTLIAGQLDQNWADPEGIVTHRRWVTRDELMALQVKPDSLAAVAWQDPDAPGYDPLEPLLR